MLRRCLMDDVKALPGVDWVPYVRREPLGDDIGQRGAIRLPGQSEDESRRAELNVQCRLHAQVKPQRTAPGTGPISGCHSSDCRYDLPESHLATPVLNNIAIRLRCLFRATAQDSSRIEVMRDRDGIPPFGLRETKTLEIMVSGPYARS